MSLTSTDIDKIRGVLKNAYEPKPAIKAARALKKLGFDSGDLWLFNKTKEARFLPDEWWNNTLNEMRDIESLGG